ncbi:MAG: hypothetical protein J3Q66DRAFT_356303 [Benniella sp.]|nr:MAG: hypothetical protein J3Q66DRAFT_356303 [Benniella sp.]
MPDLTHIFRATVQDLGQASGTTTAATAKQPVKSQQDPWIKEAHQISRTIADLRTFILTTRPAYLNLTRNITVSGHGGSRHGSSHDSNKSRPTISSKALNDLLETVSSLTLFSDKDRDSIDTRVKVMMRQIQGAIEELESLEQDRRTRQQKNGQRPGVAGWNQLVNAATGSGGLGAVDNMAQHRQGVTLYLNERLASLATLHKDQYETRIAREMEKRESSLYKSLPKPGGTNLLAQRRPNSSARTIAGSGEDDLLGKTSSSGIARTASPSPSTTGFSTAHHYQQQQQQQQQQHQQEEEDFETSLTAEQRQLFEQENENLVRKLETELNQVRQLESSMMEISSLHSTIQERLEMQTLQTTRLHEEALTAIGHIDAGNEYLIKAGKRNSSTRKWVLFFLIVASFVLLFLDWYD